MPTITHAFVSGIADNPQAAGAGEVLPSHWNAAHTISGVRTALTANTSYFVSATGSDSHGGTNSSTDAWATVQHAINFISENLDKAGFTVTINIGAGSFAGFGAKAGVGGGVIQITGAGSGSTTLTNGPADGVINLGEPYCINQIIDCIIAVNAVKLSCNFTAAGFLGFGIVDIFNQCTVFLGNFADFSSAVHSLDIILAYQNASGTELIFSQHDAFLTIALGNMVIAGDGTTLSIGLNPFEGGTIDDFGTWSSTGAANTYSSGFVNNGSAEYYIESAASYTGITCNGPRFIVDEGIIKDFHGPSLTTLPGSTAGTVSNGGIYG